MSNPSSKPDESGSAILLRAGVAFSLIFLIAGLAIGMSSGQAWMGTTDMGTLLSGGTTLRADPPRNIAEVIYGFRDLESLSFVQSGILLLILLPALRVAFLAGGFIRRRDWVFSLLAVVVLALMSAGTIFRVE